MQILPVLRGGTVVFAAASVLLAQGFIAPSNRITAPQDAGDEAFFSVALPGGTTFTFPDGTVATGFDISTNGRIFPNGAAPAATDFTPTEMEFVMGGTQIAPCWSDLISDFIYFDMSGSLAVITFADTFDFGNPGDPFTMQAQLNTANGEIRFVYDSRVPLLGDAATSVNNGIVGITDGGLAVAPGSSDLTGGAVFAAGNTLYEEFLEDGAGMPLNIADVQLLDVLFTSTGASYFTTPGVVAMDPGFIIGQTIAPGFFDATLAAREACSGGASLQFTNLAPGSYLVLPVPPGGDPAFLMGVNEFVPNGFINQAIFGPVNLPFAGGFRMPGGNIVNMVDIDPNGRVLEVGGDAADQSPSLAEFLGTVGGALCPNWHRQTQVVDFVPGMLEGGVYSHDTGTSFSITWHRTQEYACNGLGCFVFAANTQDTYQAVLFADGSFEFHYPKFDYQALTVATPAVGFGEPTNLFVGFSAGNGIADPGEADISADIFAAAGVVTGAEIYYEFFDNDGISGSGMVEGYDLDDQPNQTVALINTSSPVVGQNFECDVTDTSGTANAALYWFGFPTGLLIPSISLGVLNPTLSGCEALVDIVTPGALVAAPSGTPGTPTVIFAIPNVPALIGIEGLSTQALVLNTSLSPALFPTDELLVRVGI